MNILQKASVAIFLLSGVSLWAQPSNDDCSNPIRITDITKFCSKVGEFTNVKATPSGYGAATCWTASNKDVWFIFRAIATDISITIRGVNARNPGNAGGTLQTINAALYVGVCGGTLNQIACASDVAAAGVLSLNKGTLVVGKDYLLRVDGRNNAEGTFQICINNFFRQRKQNRIADPQPFCATIIRLSIQSFLVPVSSMMKPPALAWVKAWVSLRTNQAGIPGLPSPTAG